MPEVSGLIDRLRPVVETMGCEAVGLELKGSGRHQVLRLYIDRPDGVTLDDCTNVSHQVSALLDVEDPIPGQYVLEVSSPGLDRPLFTADDFIRFAGHQARVELSMPMDGRRRYKGELCGVEGDKVILFCEGARAQLPIAKITHARLVPDL
ncbi:MAG: ribosome maturation factor RimP [Gammaproteobacteria bacterium]|nr:MAG: ribosome maturation factor RimP [Gammaproteobacteria bacterium]